jgi:hypothetical protein
VPHPSRRRKNSVVPAVVAAKLADPATARYGFWCSETFWFVFGVVIVTDVVAESAPPAAIAAATSAATPSSTDFLVIYFSLVRERTVALIPQQAVTKTCEKV